MRLRTYVCLIAGGSCFASRYGEQFLREHTAWIEAIQTDAALGGQSARVMFIDVGANNGWYGHHYVSQLRKRAPAANVSLVMFEPQPSYYTKLIGLANSMGSGSRLIAAAAWLEDTNLTLHIPKTGDRKSVSASLSHEAKANTTTRVLVRAVSLASFLRLEAPRYDLVVLKLDVEGAEYRLLPRLLLSGSLCLVDYLHVEWHLGYEPNDGTPLPAHSAITPSSARLTGLAIRHSIDELLRRGCAADERGMTMAATRGGWISRPGAGRGPRSIIHDEAYNNGFHGFVHVGGISTLAARHASLSDLATSGLQKADGRLP